MRAEGDDDKYYKPDIIESYSFDFVMFMVNVIRF